MSGKAPIIETMNRTPRPHGGIARGASSPERDVETRTLEKVAVRRPRRYRVLLHNDDFTTMEFVVDVLRGVFDHPLESAVRLMLEVHQQGRAIAGVYPRDIAETKVSQAQAAAEQADMPLLITAEPDD